MRAIITVVILYVSLASMSGQQLPVFTQFRDNMGLINPAGFNSDYYTYYYDMYIGVSGRRQWMLQDIENAPVTSNLQFDYVWKERDRPRLLTGGYILQDQVGRMSTTGIYSRLAGFIGDPIDQGALSAGISLGYVQYRIRPVGSQPLQNGDPLLSFNQSQWVPDVGLGIHYCRELGQANNFFYAGLSIPQILALDLTFKNDNNTFSLLRSPHFYGVIGYYKTLRDFSFFEPSVWVRYVAGTPLSIDFNFRFQPIEVFWVGAGIDTAANLHFEFGLRLGSSSERPFKIAYAVDRGVNGYGPFFGYSHEVHIGFYLSNY